MNDMIEKTEELTLVLKAASDPTRRAILTTLVQQGECKVTQLADAYAMSLNAISKHIKVLEHASLINRKKVGRVHLISVNLTPLHAVESWFSQLKSVWELRLDQLQFLIEESKDDNNE